MIKAAPRKRTTKAQLQEKLTAQLHTIRQLRTEVRAKYDAAQTNTENTKHWQWADALSARAALDPSVRRTLRIRSRYEVSNSPLADSILTKLADYTVGTGPVLRLKTDNPTFNKRVSDEFQKWSIETGLAHKLWLLRYEKAQNGEAFAVMFANLPMEHPVKLDLRTVEADQVANPVFTGETKSNSDGVLFDDFGNPVGYQILKSHPGDTFALDLSLEADTYRRAEVIHYFRTKRSGQTRGVPEITSALPFFAMRRRYVLAVLAAAETAAQLAGIIKSTAPVESPDDLEPLDAIEIERRMLMTLPQGWDITQLKAEQPTNTIEMFDAVITGEIARCVNMPYGIAASNSSRYNFASGKLDNLPFRRSVAIEQDLLEDQAVDRIFARWFREATLIPGYLNANTRDIPARTWVWDGEDLLDPREAGADDTGLKNGSRSMVRIHAKRGQDAEAEWEADARLYGVSIEEYKAAMWQARVAAMSGGVSEPQDDESGDEEQ